MEDFCISDPVNGGSLEDKRTACSDKTYVKIEKKISACLQVSDRFA